MFNQEQKEAYRAIQAPAELYDRVLAKATPGKRWVLPTTLSIAAACFVMVVALGFFLKGGEPAIVLNGQPLEKSIVFYDISPASDVRSSPFFSVPVEVKAERRSEITVSHGSMTVDGGAPVKTLTAEGSVTVWWEIERSEVMPVCEMEIRDGKSTTLITLNYNNAEITATKRRKEP